MLGWKITYLQKQIVHATLVTSLFHHVMNDDILLTPYKEYHMAKKAKVKALKKAVKSTKAKVNKQSKKLSKLKKALKKAK